MNIEFGRDYLTISFTPTTPPAQREFLELAISLLVAFLRRLPILDK